LDQLSFKNPLLEKVEEKGAYGGKAPVENKIAFRKSDQKSIRGGLTGVYPREKGV
jgi:hypothetical protein